MKTKGSDRKNPKSGQKGRWAIAITLGVAMGFLGPLGAAGLIEHFQDAPGASWVYDRDGDRLDDRIPQTFSHVSVLVVYKADVTEQDIALLQALPDVVIMQRFTIAPVVWVVAKQTALDAIVNTPGVARVEYDMPMKPLLETSGAAMGARDSRGVAYDGAWERLPNGTYRGNAGNGTRIAIIEGGIDFTHPSLDDFDGAKPGPKVDLFIDGLVYAAQDPATLFGNPLVVGPIVTPPRPVAPVCDPSGPGYEDYLVAGAPCQRFLVGEPAPQGPMPSLLGGTVNDNVQAIEDQIEALGLGGIIGDPAGPVNDATCDIMTPCAIDAVDGLIPTVNNICFNLLPNCPATVPGVPRDTGLSGPDGGGINDVQEGDPYPVFQPHATAMAGIAAGTGNVSLLDPTGPEAYANAGIAPLANLADVNVFFPVALAGKGPGFGVAATISGVEAIARWNADNPDKLIDVASLSIGTDDAGLGDDTSKEALDTFEATFGFRPIPAETPSDGGDSLSIAINNLVDTGVVVVVAAGHTNEYVVAPAAARKALTVGAADAAGTICREDDFIRPESAFASVEQRADNQQGARFKPELSAPAWGVLAPVGYQPEQPTPANPHGYEVVAGTSASAAMVAGMAALMKSDDPEATAYTVKERIIRGAVSREGSNPSGYRQSTNENQMGYDTSDGAGWVEGWGYGQANAFSALGLQGILGDPVLSSFTIEPIMETGFLGGQVTFNGTLLIDDPDAARKFIDKRPCPPINFQNGVPLAHETIKFALSPNPTAGDTVAIGTTDANGTFSITGTFPRDSAYIGDNLVYGVFAGRAGGTFSSGLAKSVSDGLPVYLRAQAGVRLDLCFPNDPTTVPCNPNAPIVRYNGPGTTKLVYGTVRDDANHPVGGIGVNVEWAGTEPPMLASATTALTGGDFLLEFPVDVEPGIYHVSAGFPSSQQIFSLEENRTFSVSYNTLLTIATSVAPGTVFAPDSSPDSALRNKLVVSGVLTDVLGRPLAGQTIDVVVSAIGDTVYARPVTDAQGRYEATLALQNVNPGSYRVYAKYAGQTALSEAGIPFEVLGLGSSPRIPFSIRPVPELAVGDVEIARGDKAQITGRLTTPRGTSIAEAPIHIDVVRQGRIDRFLVETDRAGQFLLEYTPALDEVLKPGRIDVNFAGNDRYSAVQKSALLTIVSQPRLVFEDVDCQRGEPCRLEGRLIDENGNGLASKAVKLRWQGAEIGADATDGQGAFVLDYFVPVTEPLGPALVQASFEGSGVYRSVVASRFMGVVATTSLQLEAPVIDGVRASIRGRVVDEMGTAISVPAQILVEEVAANPKQFTATLELPVTGLGSMAAPILELEHAYALTADKATGQAMSLQASIDGGTTWLSLVPKSASAAKGGAVTGVSGGWATDRFDLSGFRGQDVQFALRFASDGARNATGWFVDQVSLESAGQVRWAENFTGLVGSQQGAQAKDWQATGWIVGPPQFTGPGAAAAAAFGDAIHTVTTDGRLAPGTSGDLISPRMKIPAAGQPVVAVVHAYDFRVGDGGKLEARIGDGNWNPVPRLEGVPGRIAGSSGPVTDLFDLSAYAGQTVRLRLHYDALPVPAITSTPLAGGSIEAIQIVDGRLIIATDLAPTIDVAHPTRGVLTGLVPAPAGQGKVAVTLPPMPSANLGVVVHAGGESTSFTVPMGGFGWVVNQFTVMELTRLHSTGLASDGTGLWASGWDVAGAGWRSLDGLPIAGQPANAMQAVSPAVTPDLTGLAAHTLDTNGRMRYDLPTSVETLGGKYSHIVIDGQGFIEFGGAQANPLDRPASQLPGPAFAAPLWINGNGPAEIATELTTGLAGWTLAIEWRGLQPVGAPGDGMVRMLLRSDGAMAFGYPDTAFGSNNDDEGRSAIVGVRGPGVAAYTINERAAPLAGGHLVYAAQEAAVAGLDGIAAVPADALGFATASPARLVSPAVSIPRDGAVLMMRHAADLPRSLPGSTFDEDALTASTADGTFVQPLSPWGQTYSRLGGLLADGPATTLFDLDHVGGRYVAIQLDQDARSPLRGLGWAIDEVGIYSKNTVYNTDFTTFLHPNGWTNEGDGPRWKVGDLKAAGPAPRDGVAAMSLLGPYANDANARLVSPVLNLASSPDDLVVRSWYQTEAGRDGGLVEARVVGGEWMPLNRLGEAMPRVAALEQGGLSGDSPGLRLDSYDLRGLVGNTDVKLRVAIQGTEGIGSFFWGASGVRVVDGGTEKWSARGAQLANLTQSGMTFGPLARNPDLVGVSARPAFVAPSSVQSVSGNFLYEFAPAKDDVRGEHALIISVVGQDKTLTGSQAPLVFRFTTRTSISDVSVTHAEHGNILVPGEAFRLSGRLIDVFGEPVRAATIDAKLNDEVAGNVTTNSDGFFTGQVTLPRNLTLGPGRELRLEYAGDDARFLDPTTYTHTFHAKGRTASAQNVSLEVVDGVMHVSVRLLDADKNPLRNAPVVVVVDGKTRLVTTDRNGIASDKVPVSSQDVDVSLKYRGDDQHLPYEYTTSANLVPAGASAFNWWWLIVVAAIIAIGLLVWYLVARRSSPAAQERALEALIDRSLYDLSATDSIRQTIFRIYSDLIDHLHRFGFTRQAATTAGEAAHAAILLLPGSKPDLKALTGVFEMARYSDLPMGEEYRREASTHLRGILQAMQAARAPEADE